MILYPENTKDSTKTLLELINPTHLQIQINTHKSDEIPLTRNDLSEKELKKTIPFIIV